VNTHDISTLGHLHLSPAKPRLSPRVTISPDTPQSPAKHDKTRQNVATVRERERAITESNDPEEIVHYRIVEIPVERMVVKDVQMPTDTHAKSEDTHAKFVDFPVEKYVDKVVDRPVTQVVERRVEVPVDRVVYVDVPRQPGPAKRFVEVPVDRVVHLEVPVDRVAGPGPCPGPGAPAPPVRPGRASNAGGEGAGLGLLLQQEAGDFKIYVERVVQGCAADRSGQIEKGDVLVAVDGRSVHDLDLDAVRKLITGPEGSPVTLQLLRAGRQPYTATMARAHPPRPIGAPKAAAGGGSVQKR